MQTHSLDNSSQWAAPPPTFNCARFVRQCVLCKTCRITRAIARMTQPLIFRCVQETHTAAALCVRFDATHGLCSPVISFWSNLDDLLYGVLYFFFAWLVAQFIYAWAVCRAFCGSRWENGWFLIYEERQRTAGTTPKCLECTAPAVGFNEHIHVGVYFSCRNILATDNFLILNFKPSLWLKRQRQVQHNISSKSIAAE